MRVGLVQIDAGVDKARNLDLVRNGVADARAAGARLVAFPEFSMYEKKVVDGTFAGAAEPLDGPFVTALSAIAAEHGVTLVVGIVESNPDDPRPFNTLLVVDETGRVQARYRKIHLFDSYGFHESACIAPAPSLEPVVFDVDGITVGLMTCYDLRFPELGRELADAGAELVLVCSSWVPGEGKAGQWRVLAQARAIENSYFVGAVSQTPPVSIGRSVLVDPLGAVVGELDEPPALGTFDLDPADVLAAREKNPALTHRRYSISREASAS